MSYVIFYRYDYILYILRKNLSWIKVKSKKFFEQGPKLYSIFL